ncbi:type II CRISPR-associated endonuclease Cas1 [Endomicrobium proavitum]|uniref:CRISPR-associated endonuclease Cas1 n=1 Tax=Endomicrobium proavitum TaxID=1408281 RepID=A0A0G3WJJ2_9BACT|nr:type II CRISPR-associated endonuclease Cas1 [Endomicrobium proavitum]AKL98453.1 putative CRISPR-associated endonuclease Cas1 [Endomicrobium proavitum]
MSYHIIHILNHASRLSVDRGCLVCDIPDKPQRRVPLEDILAVIVAAKGVSFSAESLSALLRNNSIVLHCDHNYKPIGKTVGLHRVVHNEVLDIQVFQDLFYMRQIWDEIIKAKISNQACVLDGINAKHKLWEYIKAGNLDEGNAARHYWKYYFKKFGHSSPGGRTTKGAQDPVNGMLNYGYAVIAAMVHRLLLAHGFNPAIGVYHKYRFRSDPLVYDIMEPLRPFCDFMLLRFRQSNMRKQIDEWAKFAAKDIVFSKINMFGAKNISFNLAIDKYITSFSSCFRAKTLNNLYIPLLKDITFNEK